MTSNASNILTGLSSSLTSSTRAWKGLSVVKNNIGNEQPVEMLVLYDMENCPYCRIAREAFTELDLDVEIRPCGKGNEASREKLKALGGKVMVPYLIDDNTGVSLYESNDIVNYLYQEYGNGKKRGPIGKLLTLLTSYLASASRLSQGIKTIDNHANIVTLPNEPLELYSFEASPYCRPVRERLTEIGIPYIIRNVGKQQLSDMGTPAFRLSTKAYAPLQGSKREALQSRGGKVQVPYLIDPNTQTEMYESQDIIHYLNAQYAS